MLPQKKSGVTARKVGSYRKKSRELPQKKSGVTASRFRVTAKLSGVTAIVGSYRKLSGVTANHCRELPQEKSGVTAKKSGVTARKVGSYRKKCRKWKKKSGVTARKVGSYRKKSRELPQKKSGVTANSCRELPQTFSERFSGGYSDLREKKIIFLKSANKTLFGVKSYYECHSPFKCRIRLPYMYIYSLMISSRYL